MFATLPKNIEIDRYNLGRKLGSGGMGEVYLAEQKQPIARTVAIKLIRPGCGSREVLSRFQAEQQTLASLDHPGIARILDAGVTSTGRPFFAMEFVPGKPMTQFADDQKLTVSERLQLFLLICDAVEYAHTQGVIHGDLKPGNLLAWVDDQTQRMLVKVIDFGIATVVAGNFVADTETAGSDDYMSPEQLAGDAVDVRTDVYSLGIVLYELLVGAGPFPAGQPEAEQRTRRAIRASDRLRALGEYVSADRATVQVELARTLRSGLEWIPAKALRRRPSRRYQTVAALAHDVRNYLGGLETIAEPGGVWGRLIRFARRHVVDGGQ